MTANRFGVLTKDEKKKEEKEKDGDEEEGWNTSVKVMHVDKEKKGKKKKPSGVLGNCRKQESKCSGSIGRRRVDGDRSHKGQWGM